MAGLLCTWTSASSFGAPFSSILLTTRNPELDAVVLAKETQGTFPMSRQLGRVKLILQLRIHEGEMWTTFVVAKDLKKAETEPNETKAPTIGQ